MEPTETNGRLGSCHLNAAFEVEGDVSPHNVDEVRAALRELGLSEGVETECGTQPPGTGDRTEKE